MAKNHLRKKAPLKRRMAISRTHTYAPCAQHARGQSQSHLPLQLDPFTTYTNFFTRALYTVYAPFAWGGALGEFDTSVHSSAGPLKSETLDVSAD